MSSIGLAISRLLLTSYRWLTPYAAFVNGDTTTAAEVVCGSDGVDAYDVDDLIVSLVDKSLVEHDGKRFGLLETTRQFAADRLDRAGDTDRVRAAHTAFFTDLAHKGWHGLQGPDEAAWDAWLAADWDNLRAAFQWACDRDDADAANSIAIDLGMHGLFRQPEAFLWSQEAFQRFGTVEHPNRTNSWARPAMPPGHSATPPVRPKPN
jgi:predicted ATPase